MKYLTSYKGGKRERELIKLQFPLCIRIWSFNIVFSLDHAQ